MGEWTDPYPVYVTRENAHGVTGTISISGWQLALATTLVTLNVIAWSCLGLYEAARIVIG